MDDEHPLVPSGVMATTAGPPPLSGEERTRLLEQLARELGLENVVGAGGAAA